MSLVDSRLGPGTLTLGTTEYGAQASNVRLVPAHTETDGTPTLADPDPAVTVTTKWTLQGTAIQDFASATGFVEYCREHNGQTVAFDWTPNTVAGAAYDGTCIVKAVEIGGDAGVQLTTDFEFIVIGEPTRTDGV